ncbi:MAG: hypothetical protein WBN40_06885 [Pseudomonadales bacterium]
MATQQHPSLTNQNPFNCRAPEKTRKLRSQYGFLRQARLERAAESLNQNDSVNPNATVKKRQARQDNRSDIAATSLRIARRDRQKRHGKAALLGSAALALAATQAQATTVFINEIHYDNSGVDVNEGIEIAGRAGTSLDGWQLQLYNGDSGEVYRTLELAATFNDGYNGYGIIHVVTGSLQNGPADGFALLDIDGDVVQFLSYEGQVSAVSGGAAGMTSIDIGVAEDSEAPEGLSLQLIGAGSVDSDFTWTTSFSSMGVANFGQTFVSSTSQVPLPASAWLFGTALAALRMSAKQRRSASPIGDTC